jgi:hypothetical protein
MYRPTAVRWASCLMLEFGTMQRRMFWAILILGCAGLFGYVLYRAIHLSFVHDESLSFTIVLGDPSWTRTANHHPLNTELMRWSSARLGTSELALRIPNVLSFLLYLTAGMLLLSKLHDVWMICLGFALLNLNPFVLEFFSLARGYGIASGLSLTALFFFTKAWYASKTSSVGVWLLMSSVFSTLADLANLAWINVHGALFAGALVIVFWDRTTLRPRVDRRRMICGAVLIFANSWGFYNTAKRILVLQEDGQLYAGGHRGFLPDTVGSLVQTYLYAAVTTSWWADSLLYWVVGTVSSLGIWLAYRLIKDRRPELSTILYGVLVAAGLAPVVEHLAFGALFPMDRTALYYVPLVTMVIIFSANEMCAGGQLKRVVVRGASFVVVVLMLVHFSRAANLTHTFLWHYDADTKAAMLDLAARLSGSDGPIRIGNDWVLEPTINYYRVRHRLDWLSPATRDGLSSQDNDVVLRLRSDISDAHPDYVVVKYYPTSGTELLLRKPRFSEGLTQ